MIKLRRKAIYPEKLEVLYDAPFTKESLERDFDIRTETGTLMTRGGLSALTPTAPPLW